MRVNPFYQLSRIKAICKFISTLAAVILVNSFIVSRVDYCNSIVAGLQTCRLDRIQSVLNPAARLIYGRTPSDHTTDLLSDNLYWLRVPLRIAYTCKLCLIAYKTLNDRCMSDYISNLCCRYKATILVEKSSTRPRRHGLLRSLSTVHSLLQEY